MRVFCTCAGQLRTLMDIQQTATKLRAFRGIAAHFGMPLLLQNVEWILKMNPELKQLFVINLSIYKIIRDLVSSLFIDVKIASIKPVTIICFELKYSLYFELRQFHILFFTLAPKLFYNSLHLELLFVSLKRSILNWRLT